MAGEHATVVIDGVSKSYIIGISRFARNDRFQENVILRHEVPKNLVPGNENPSVRRTRCFTPFSMTSRGGHPGHRGVAFVFTDGALTSSIMGISQSPLHGSLEMTTQCRYLVHVL
jgi:hypothetical protein